MTTLLTILVVWFVLSLLVGLFLGRIFAMQNSDGRAAVKPQVVTLAPTVETTDKRTTAEMNALSFKPAS